MTEVLSFEIDLHKFCTGAVPCAAWLMAPPNSLPADFLPEEKAQKSFEVPEEVKLTC
jgi:hypothetical protein